MRVRSFLRAFLPAIMTSALLLTLSLAADAPQFKQATAYVLGGEGGWDCAVYDASANRVFIAHGTAVYVMDAATGKKLGEIPADGAHGIALVPALNRGFSTNGKPGTVTAFDMKTLKPIQDIKAGDGSDVILYDPHSKRVIALNGRSKDATIIDPATMKVVATVALNGKPEFGAADKGHVYVNSEDTAEILDVDTRTWKVAQRWKIADCEEPTGLAIDTKQHRLFAACNKKMAVVDAKSGKTIGSVATGDGTDGAEYHPGLKLAFAPNGEGTLTLIRETKNGKYEAAGSVQTQRGARTMALDPKTHTVFLPTAEFGPPAAGQRRPSVKPGTFTVLVFHP